MQYTNPPLVDILILNWNGYDLTKACIDSIQNINYPNYRIVLVDNASTDGSVKRIRAEFDDLIIIETESNLGYAEEIMLD